MTTTSDARKRLAEKHADRTAPTPAPVAVLEDRAAAFGRAAEMLRADKLMSTEVRSAVAKWLEAVATVWAGAEQHHDYDDGPIEFEETIDGLAQDVTDAILTPRPEPVVSCAGHATCNALVHEHGCYNDHGSCDPPEEHRPEPVVAPLPSEPAPEAVVLDRDGDAWQRGPEETDGWWCSSPVDEQDISWPRLFKEYGPLRRLVAEDDEDTVRVLDQVREAVAQHPNPCEKHPDDDGITCGWKSAYRDVVRALGLDPFEFADTDDRTNP